MDPDRPDCRMFREVLLIVARKNGKTLLAAAIMAYMAYILNAIFFTDVLNSLM